MARRSLPLVVVVFLLALLVPAPLTLSAIVRPSVGRIGRFSVRPEQRRKIGNFLKDHVWDLLDAIQNILPPSGDNKGDKLDSAAAHSAGLYMFNLSVGTGTSSSSSPQNVTGVLDITLSFVWAQCEPCSSCLPAPAPSFRPSMSPTFSTVPCASQTCQSLLNQTCLPGPVGSSGGSCGYTVVYYGDGATNTTGNLANDTFTFGQIPAPVLFGCSSASFGDFSGDFSGSFGFGRGPLSLPSQLRLSWFSYTLSSSDDSGSGGGDNLLQFGDDAADIPRKRGARSTPLVRNGVYPDFYYVKLKGIQVGGQDLAGVIPAGTFDLQANGSGGVFLSTTTPVTYLEEAAYKVVKQALVRGIASEAVNGSALGLDLCYVMQAVELKVPKLTLVFDGVNAVMELRKRNYFFSDNATGLECLTILPLRDVSVLGSLVQADTSMSYDIDGGQLIFETAFAPPPHYTKLSASLMVAVPLVAWVLLF